MVNRRRPDQMRIVTMDRHWVHRRSGRSAEATGG